VTSRRSTSVVGENQAQRRPANTTSARAGDIDGDELTALWAIACDVGRPQTTVVDSNKIAIDRKAIPPAVLS
jgi:hypothetical protein